MRLLPTPLTKGCTSIVVMISLFLREKRDVEVMFVFYEEELWNS